MSATACWNSDSRQWKVLQQASFFSCQAAAALKDLYKKHPVLYNSSIVCSFEPKVIYRVRGCWWAQISSGEAGLHIGPSNNLSSLASQHWLLCHISYICWLCYVVIAILIAPDETEWPSCGHSADSPAVEPESARKRHPSLFLSVETPLDDPDGHRVGLGPSSHPVEALWDLSLPHTEELCLAVSLSPSVLFLTWGFDNLSVFWPLKCLCCRDYVQYWSQRGVEVVAWTVNTNVEKEYYQELLKVNYITDSLVEDCEPHYWDLSER